MCHVGGLQCAPRIHCLELDCHVMSVYTQAIVCHVGAVHSVDFRCGMVLAAMCQMFAYSLQFGCHVCRPQPAVCVSCV